MNWWLVAMILTVIGLCIFTAYVEFTILDLYKGFFK